MPIVGLAIGRLYSTPLERDRYVVLSVTYALEKNGGAKIVYKDLIEHFADREPSLARSTRGRSEHSPLKINGDRRER